MCGISLIVSQTQSADIDVQPGCSDYVKTLRTDLIMLLTARGPDAQNAATITLPVPLFAGSNTNSIISSDSIEMWMFGSVLHIQGESITAQPCIDQEGNVLLWNGEVFGQSDNADNVHCELDIREGESDTIAVARMLTSAADSVVQSAVALDHNELCRAITTAIVHCLSAIHGPYAFVYYHKQNSSIHFGRDPFGRRSLVLGYPVPLIDSVCSDTSTGVEFVVDAHHPFALSSVCPPKATASKFVTDSVQQASSLPDATSCIDANWEEVNITGVYCLHLKNPQSNSVGSMMNLICTPWPLYRLRVGRGLGSTESVRNSLVERDSGVVFCETLQAAVQRRVASMPSAHNLIIPDIPTTTVTSETTTTSDLNTVPIDNRSRVGVLFSGGIDSVLLTALLHHATAPGLAIDLLNVTFIKTTGSNPSNGGLPSPDRVAAIAALLELQTIFPSREWRLVHIDVTEEERFAHEQHIMNLIRPSDTHMDLNIGTAFWFASRGKGYLRTYSTAELSALFAATTDNTGEEDVENDAGESGRSAKGRGKYNQQGRPLLRHGASGAAAGVGRRELNNPTTTTIATPVPVLVELSAGKYKCSLDSCSRVYKTGCVRYLCKKCCDLHHRNTVLGSELCEESSEGGNDGIANMKNRLRFLELDSPNPCPAHRAKPKQVNKMRANIDQCLRKGMVENSVMEDEVEGATEVTADGESALCASALSSSPSVSIIDMEIITDTVGTNSAITDPSATNPTLRTTLATPIATSPVITIPYQCHCKALLVGIGADEQMAGYGRHRTDYLKALKDAQNSMALNINSSSDANITSPSYSNSETEPTSSIGCMNGSNDQTVVGDSQSSNSAEVLKKECEAIATAALEAELNKDLHRLWKRNLGRDDRCISDNGREAWFPFLDEQVVALLQSLPMDQICDLNQAQGIGDKRILRSAARHVGLAQCTELVKRAIQFGTRVAQHTNQQYHGSNRKGKGDTKIEE